jgi:hypothetical protein
MLKNAPSLDFHVSGYDTPLVSSVGECGWEYYAPEREGIKILKQIAPVLPFDKSIC